MPPEGGLAAVAGRVGSECCADLDSERAPVGANDLPSQAWLGRFYPADGLMWSQISRTPERPLRTFFALVVSGPESFLVAGARSSPEQDAGNDGWLAEFDYEGSQRWTASVAARSSVDPQRAVIVDLAQNDSGGFVVEGTFAQQARALKLSEGGSVLWSHSRETLLEPVQAERPEAEQPEAKAWLSAFDLAVGSVSVNATGTVAVAGGLYERSRFGRAQRPYVAWQVRLDTVQPEDMTTAEHAESELHASVSLEGGASVSCGQVRGHDGLQQAVTGTERAGEFDRAFVRKLAHDGSSSWTAASANGDLPASQAPIRPWGLWRGSRRRGPGLGHGHANWARVRGA